MPWSQASVPGIFLAVLKIDVALILSKARPEMRRALGDRVHVSNSLPRDQRT